MHLFDQICVENGIEHRLTKVNHPWRVQVERMNQTIKKATVHTYYYKDHSTLQKHLEQFILAYNHAKQLRTLNGKTPKHFYPKCLG